MQSCWRPTQSATLQTRSLQRRMHGWSR
jgi:hypothetical protein